MTTNKKVTEAEYKVLEVLWAAKQAMSVKQIMAELEKKGTIWANRTVLVFLNNLEKKKAVGKLKEKITFYYYPIVAKEDFVKEASKNFLEKYFSGSLTSFLSAFTKNNNSVSKEELYQLQEWIDSFDK